MYEKLQKEIKFELAELRKLFDSYRKYFEKSYIEKPEEIEIMALAAILHSFYTGIEGILKRIAIRVDGSVPLGEIWHSQLLGTMSKPGKNRSKVISDSLEEKLRHYLNFRHMFRHAYTFHLNWERMEPLVRECENTFHVFENELELFLEETKGKNQ